MTEENHIDRSELGDYPIGRDFDLLLTIMVGRAQALGTHELALKMFMIDGNFWHPETSDDELLAMAMDELEAHQLLPEAN